MRTTIRLDDDLLAQLKQLALETGRTLTRVIEDAVREALSRRHHSGGRAPVKLRTFRGQGLQPSVDLDDSAALRELMDRPDASA